MKVAMDPKDKEAPIWAPRNGEFCRRDFTTATIRRNRTSGAEEENRTTITINTDGEDRHGTVIEPSGARLDNYNRNPVVLINHSRSLLAGTSSVSLRNGQLVANMEDEDWDLDDPDIERWWRKVKNGVMRAASIGFRSHEVEKELIDPDGDPYDYSNVRYRITDWELLEWSYVTVPSNPGALVTQRELRQEDDRLLFTLQGIEEKLDNMSKRLPPEEAAPAAARDEVADAASDNDSARAAGSDDPEPADEAEPADPDEAAHPEERDQSADRPNLVRVRRSDLAELYDEARRQREKAALKAAKQITGRA